MFRAEIVNSEGGVVKEFEWQGIPPSEIVWDGRDENGNPFPEGLYNYSISGEDDAGNSSENRISNIELTTVYEKVSMTANQHGISPNGDGFLDKVEFITDVSSEKGLEEWKLEVYSNQGRVIKTMSGPGMPPSLITWDGTGESRDLVPDGVYSYTMALTYISGNHPSSESGSVIVDSTAPDLNFVVSPRLFSPDGDGEADTLYIRVELEDRNGVSGWEVAIYRKWDGKTDKEVPFKKVVREGEYKGTMKWDGYSDPLQMHHSFMPPDDITYKPADGGWSVLVDSASSYAVDLKASDIYNNRINARRDFETDILVIRTPFGLKIMINAIQFEFNKADLRPQSFSILDRLTQILEKFPNYKIKVVGHTDWIGSDEYNQKLSEKRAYSVYKYLVEHDVDKEMLSTEGKGETQPIDDNDTESGRARNRRVEFYLTEKQ